MQIIIIMIIIIIIIIIFMIIMGIRFDSCQIVASVEGSMINREVMPSSLVMLVLC